MIRRIGGPDPVEPPDWGTIAFALVVVLIVGFCAGQR